MYFTFFHIYSQPNISHSIHATNHIHLILSTISHTQLPKFHYLQIANIPAVDHHPHQRPYLLPTMRPGCPRIYMQQPQPLVIHHLQNMRMPAHHQPYTTVSQRPLHPWRILPRITPYMTQLHPYSLYLKLFHLAALSPYLPAIYIPAHGPNRRNYLPQTPQNADVTYVAGMPYLIAILEMNGIPLIPTRMCIRQNSYSFHLFHLYNFQCQRYDRIPVMVEIGHILRRKILYRYLIPPTF